MRSTRWASVRKLPTLMVFALTAAMVPGALAAQSGVGEVSLAIGSVAPDVVVQDLDGNELNLLDVIDGRPALIEFWATWCENCEALQPQLDQIQAAHGEELAVVALAVAVAQSQRRVRRHVESHEAGYPYLWDEGGNAVRAYEASTTSVVVLLNAEGEVAYTGVGGDQDLLGAVEALLAG
ncbi:MAG: TlpA family protein disulfide reductase [Longimicrobiales bacterium]